MSLNPYIKIIMTIPCIGEVFMKFVLNPFLRKRRKERNHITCPEQLQECFDSTSLLQIFRDGALGDQSMLYQRLGEQLRSSASSNLRILVLWGSLDKVVHDHHIARIMDLLDPLDGIRLEYERLEGLQHNQLSADPHRCAEAIFSRIIMTGTPSIMI